MSILEAMRAGDRECLTESLDGHEALEAAIDRCSTAQKTPDVGGQLFAFVGAKGGVGTTTVAVNVATVAGARMKHRTLFIDLHVAYGDAAVFLGAEPKFSVVDALESIHRLDAALFKSLVTPTAAGVDLLASSNQGADVDDRCPAGAPAARVRASSTIATWWSTVRAPTPPRSTALKPPRESCWWPTRNWRRCAAAAGWPGMLRRRLSHRPVMVVVSRFDVVFGDRTRRCGAGDRLDGAPSRAERLSRLARGAQPRQATGPEEP